MKNILKPLLIIIILAMLLSLTSCLLTSEFTFELNEDGKSYKLAGAGCGGSNIFAETITIPSTYNGLPVTTIGNNALLLCRNVKHVIIPDSVTTLEDDVFTFNLSIETIEIPDSVLYIGIGSLPFGDNVLYNQYKDGYYLGNKNNPYHVLAWVGKQDTKETITDFEIHSNTKVVHGFGGFDKLTSVTIPDSVISISPHAFSGCSSIKSVVIGNSVTNIGYNAFMNCDSLESIVIPESVTTIGKEAFADCPSLTSIVIPATVTTMGRAVFYNRYDYYGPITVYCEAEFKPDGWDDEWDVTGTSITVIWGYKGE